MATITNLDINLIAKTRRFDEPVERSRELFKSSMETIRNDIEKLTGIRLDALDGTFQDIKGSIDAFKDASREGAGALTKFHAAAMAFDTGVNIGLLISGYHQQMEELNNELERSVELHNAAKAAREQFNDIEELEISLLRDPDEKAAAFQDYMDRIRTELRGAETMAEVAANNFEEASTAWTRWTGNKVLGVDPTQMQQAADHAAELREHLTSLEQQQRQMQMRREASDEYAAVDASRRHVEQVRELALRVQDVSEGQALSADEAYRMTNFSKLNAEQHQQVTGWLNDQLEAWREKNQLEQEAAAEAERIANANKGYLQSLELQLVALRDGAEAARELRAINAGISPETIEAGREIQRQIAELKAEQAQAGTAVAQADRERPAARPSVNAVTFGSSAAVSAIVEAQNKQGDPTTAAIKSAAAQASRDAQATTDAINDLGAGAPQAVVVKIFGE